MKKKVEIALLKSRVHWWTAHSFDVEDVPPEHVPSGENCALCTIFLGRTGSCSKCPVMIETGRVSCRETPHEYALSAHRNQNRIAWKHHSRLMAEFLDAIYEEQTE